MLNIVTLDFESFYSDTFKLKKLTTEAYVRSPLFELIGVGIKVGSGKSRWFPKPLVAKALAALNLENAVVLCHNCVTPDHEVLTSHGWTRFDLLTGGEQIAQWDPLTQEASFTGYTPITQHFSGELLEWDTTHHKGVYTPQHRMFTSTPDVRKWIAVPANEIATRSMNNTYIPTAASKLVGNDTLDMSPNEARLLEAIRADGTWNNGWSSKGYSYAVRFRLKKLRKIARLKWLLDANSQPYTEKVSGDITNISLCATALTRRLSALLGTEKQYNEWVISIPASAQRAILEEAAHWDGCVTPAHSRSSYVLSSAEHTTMEWMHTLAALNGMTMRLAAPKPNTRGFSAAHSMLTTGTVRDRTKAKLISPPTRRYYEGKVYCVQVPTGAFLIRRNGAIWATGNCAFDGLILSHHYGIRPKMFLDTMLMAKPYHHATTGVSLAKLATHYGLGAKGHEIEMAKGKRFADFTPEELKAYGGYCCNDCDLTYELFAKLLPKFQRSELQFIDKVLRTFTEPSLFWDEDLLRIHLDDVIARKQAMLERVSAIAGPGDLSSNAKFLGVLEKFGGRWPRSMMSSDEAYMEYLKDMESKEGYKPHLFDIPTKTREATATEQAKKGLSGDVVVWALAKKDEAFLALQEIEDEELQAVINARLGTKSTIAETRAARMLEAASRGAFPVSLQYYAAHTGRLGGGGESSNAQNFPKAKGLTEKDVGFMCMTPEGPARLQGLTTSSATTDKGEFAARDCTTICIRHCLVPPKGKKMVVADSSQVECRTLAWMAGQDDLVQVFADGRDPYSEFATSVYGYEVSKKTPVERFVGKTAQLGLGYGTGHLKLQTTLALGQGDIHVIIPVEESKRIVDTYRKVKYPMIPAFWKTCHQALVAASKGHEMFFGPDNIFHTSKDTIWLPNGMPITYTNLQWVVEEDGEKGFKYWGKKDGRYQWVRIYGSKCVENICQAITRIMVSDAWVRISQRAPVVLQVHDELVCVVDEDEADECLEFMIKGMSVAPPWAKGLPLAAEGDTGYSYAACK